MGFGLERWDRVLVSEKGLEVWLGLETRFGEFGWVGGKSWFVGFRV